MHKWDTPLFWLPYLPDGSVSFPVNELSLQGPGWSYTSEREKRSKGVSTVTLFVCFDFMSVGSTFSLLVAFSSLVRILGECTTIHPQPVLFSFSFLMVKISSCTLQFLSLCQDQSTVAQQAETSGQMFPDKLCVSSFPDRFPHYAWIAAKSAHSDFVGSRVYAYLGVTCYLTILAEWPGSFTCHSGNKGVERAPN